jgi:hypothetical protein
MTYPRTRILILAVLSLLILACGLPGINQPEVTNPSDDQSNPVTATQSTGAKKTNTPKPTQTPLPPLELSPSDTPEPPTDTVEPSITPDQNLGSLTFEGITFTYSKTVFGGVNPSFVPAVPPDQGAPWETSPDTIRFEFNDYVLKNTFHQPVIFIYPIKEFRDISDIAAQIIDQLTEQLQTKPASVNGALPFLPIWNAGELFHTQIEYLDFTNGSGVRYLAQYGQSFWPINNNSLFYTFQGITNDGRFYVAAILPASHSSLPATGDEVPGGDFNAFADNYANYAIDLAGQLNAEFASSFNPSLDDLDNLIRSITIDR